LKKIKLFEPYHDVKEENAIRTVLKSKFWASGSGINNVEKFEKKFAKFVNSGTCVSVNSGTAALHLAISLFNPQKKNILLPSLSFVSTSHAVLYNDAKPIFVDVNLETLCIDPNEISDKISDNTAMIIPVHFGGLVKNLDKIKKIAKDEDAVVVDDAAHACGAKFKSKKIGSMTDATCFSFHPVKNLSMPTGGAITFNKKNSDLFERRLKSLRWCGISSRSGNDYDVTELGWNYYMNEFSASIGLEQLKKLNSMNTKRQKIAKRYFDEIKIPEKMPYEKDCSYHLYWILVENRNNFIKKMSHKKIEIGTHYRPIHTFSFYNKKINLPNTQYVSQRIVTLPIHPNLSENEVSTVIKYVNKFSTQ